MKENNHVNFTIGFALILFAAFIMVILMPPILANKAVGIELSSPVFHIGKVLFTIYGFSSLLVPFFLLAAGITMFLPNWSMIKGIYLSSSIFPFFTFVLGEKVYYMITQTGDSSLKWIKALTVLTVIIIICIIEYIVVSMIMDIYNSNPEKPKSDNEQKESKVANIELLKEISLKIPRAKETTDDNLYKEPSFIEKMFIIQPDAAEVEQAKKNHKKNDLKTIIKTSTEQSPITENFEESIPQVDDMVVVQMGNDMMGKEIESEEIISSLLPLRTKKILDEANDAPKEPLYVKIAREFNSDTFATLNTEESIEEPMIKNPPIDEDDSEYDLLADDDNEVLIEDNYES
ncbi:MAG: hypothetical protein ACRC5H_07185, partial [Treponemataceae bacterium]